MKKIKEFVDSSEAVQVTVAFPEIVGSVTIQEIEHRPTPKDPLVNSIGRMFNFKVDHRTGQVSTARR